VTFVDFQVKPADRKGGGSRYGRLFCTGQAADRKGGGSRYGRLFCTGQAADRISGYFSMTLRIESNFSCCSAEAWG
jgi:hypothetical protein